MTYYEDHAQEFFESTAHLDMSALYAPFLALLPSGGRIIDLGCGSGRDSVFFRNANFSVVAIDASQKMCELAQAFVGPDVEVRCMTAQKIEFEEEFDGIWACASLLHVPAGEMVTVLRRLRSALKRSGVLYCSYKMGEGERLDKHGRLFTNANERMAEEWLQAADLDIINSSITQDVRPGRSNEAWINVLAGKGLRS